MRPVLSFVSLISLIACAENSATTQTGFANAPTENLDSYFTCLDAADKTLVSAHRGGPAPGYPENTIETLKRTVEQTGVILLEIDIQTSKDGVLFLFHDNNLDWETTGKGPVAEKTWAELKEFSVKDKTQQPTAYRLTRFDEALTWAEGKAILQLDIKRGTDYDDVALAVNAAGAGDRVIPIAYSRNQALALVRRFPNSMISVPIDSDQELKILQERGISRNKILAWTGTKEINEDLYKKLDNSSVEVVFGTLGSRQSKDIEIQISRNDDEYAAIAKQGVDIIATDRPAEARAALIAAGKWPAIGECQT